MADEGTVNGQITDSVTQVIAAVLGHAAPETTGMLDALMAETVGMAMYNAVTTQHNSQMVSAASVTAACARMLKTSAAPPLPFKLVSPVVTAIAPLKVPVNVENQTIRVSGSNFQPGLSVDIFNSDGTKVGTLSGSLQISDVSPASFTMTVNLFTVEGTYGMEVVNPDGGRSSRFQFSAAAMPAVITNVCPSNSQKPHSYQVTGSNFQKSLSAEVCDHKGTLLNGTVVSEISATTFTMVISPGDSTGPFGVEVVNPDKCRSNFFLFTAKPVGDNSTSLAKLGDVCPS